MMPRPLLLLLGMAGGLFIFSRAAGGQNLINATASGLDNAGQSLGVTEIKTAAEKNVAAFLKTIRAAEGTAGIEGYRTLFGGGLFLSYADHPRQVVRRKSGTTYISSSAAGAFQIIQSTWDGLQAKLNLPDFSPESQDKAAIELIREKGALEDVKAGRFAVAVEKVRKVWASFPAAGYGQPEKSYTVLASAYLSAGGVMA